MQEVDVSLTLPCLSGLELSQLDEHYQRSGGHSCVDFSRRFRVTSEATYRYHPPEMGKRRSPSSESTVLSYEAVSTTISCLQ